MVLSYAVCNVSVAPLKAEPTHRSEQVSQLLFGERAEIIEIEKNGWAKIICEWDEYIGWVRESQLTQMPYKEYKKPLHHINLTNKDCIETPDGKFFLSPGSSLFQLRKKIFLWNKNYHFKGEKKKLKLAKKSGDTVKKLALQFIGSPYQWGGRNLMGIDCSGLTQVVYKMMNIGIPRDACQQAEMGHTVSFLQEARCGDLAFFDNAEGKITHVGILLDNDTIIHVAESGGQVVIDKIDNGGIISKNLKKRTHTLRIIKRISEIL